MNTLKRGKALYLSILALALCILAVVVLMRTPLPESELEISQEICGPHSSSLQDCLMRKFPPGTDFGHLSRELSARGFRKMDEKSQKAGISKTSFNLPYAKTPNSAWVFVEVKQDQSISQIRVGF